MAALDRPCPGCDAPAGQKCTRPTDTTRVDVNWVHASREDDTAQ